MKDDVRTACLALVKGHSKGPMTGRRIPRASALGWKLESGVLAEADLDTLRESVRSAVGGGATPLRHWMASEPLRALLAEYHAVRRGVARAAGPACAQRTRRVMCPGDHA